MSVHPGPMPVQQPHEDESQFSRRKAQWQGRLIDWRHDEQNRETPEDTARILEAQRVALWGAGTAVPVPPPPAAQVMAPPSPTGNVCRSCGGSMVRTGACETCTSCGDNTGCG